MASQQDIQQVARLINKEVERGQTLNHVVTALEKQGIDPDTIQEAVLVYDQPEKEPAIAPQKVVKKKKIYVPLTIYGAVYALLMVIIVFAYAQMLSAFSLPKIAIGVGLIAVLIFTLIGIGNFLINAFVLQFCARWFVKDRDVNTLSNALWQLLISLAGSMYVVFGFMLIFSTRNWFLLFLCMLGIMFILNLATLSFFYHIPLISSFQLAIIFAIVNFFVSLIVQAIYKAAIYALIIGPLVAKTLP